MHHFPSVAVAVTHRTTVTIPVVTCETVQEAVLESSRTSPRPRGSSSTMLKSLRLVSLTPSLSRSRLSGFGVALHPSVNAGCSTAGVDVNHIRRTDPRSYLVYVANSCSGIVALTSSALRCRDCSFRSDPESDGAHAVRPVNN